VKNIIAGASKFWCGLLVTENRLLVTDGLKLKDQKMVISLISFWIFGARFLGDFEDFFTTSTWVSVIYPKVIIFHKFIVIFIIYFVFKWKKSRFLQNLSRKKILDLEVLLLSEFDKIGMVGLVIEWVVRFCEFRRIPRCVPHG